MRLGARQASTEFALFSRLGATSRTTDRQGSFPFRSHGYTMRPGLGNKLFNSDHEL